MMYTDQTDYGQLAAALTEGNKQKKKKTMGVAGILVRIYGMRGNRQKEVEMVE